MEMTTDKTPILFDHSTPKLSLIEVAQKLNISTSCEVVRKAVDFNFWLFPNRDINLNSVGEEIHPDEWLKVNTRDIYYAISEQTDSILIQGKYDLGTGRSVFIRPLTADSLRRYYLSSLFITKSDFEILHNQTNKYREIVNPPKSQEKEPEEIKKQLENLKLENSRLKKQSDRRTLNALERKVEILSAGFQHLALSTERYVANRQDNAFLHTENKRTLVSNSQIATMIEEDRNSWPLLEFDENGKAPNGTSFRKIEEILRNAYTNKNLVSTD